MKLACIVAVVLATAWPVSRAQEQESGASDTSREGNNDAEGSGDSNASDDAEKGPGDSNARGNEATEDSSKAPSSKSQVTEDDLDSKSAPSPSEADSQIPSGGLIGGPWEQAKIDSVPSDVRYNWCLIQVQTCVKQCTDTGSKADGPTCNSANLSWNCRCDNGDAPDLAKEDFTIPYFQCRYDWEVCNVDCGPGDQECVDKCNEDFVCGTGKAVEIEKDDDKPEDEDKSNRSGAKNDDNRDFGGDAPSLSVGLGAVIAMLVGVLAH